MLVYQLLGEQAEQSFSHSFAVSYGVQAAKEWKAIFKASLKTVLVLVLLERLFLTTPQAWLEEAIDYYSLQALLYGRTAVGFAGQINTFFTYSKRVHDDE